MMIRKKAYSTPVLSIHGTAEEITKQSAKTDGGGDGRLEQPYGKVPGAADSHDQHSRS